MTTGEMQKTPSSDLPRNKSEGRPSFSHAKSAGEGGAFPSPAPASRRERRFTTTKLDPN